MRHLVGLTFLFFATTASAQDLPDVVRLRDGSYVRGTIVERFEGEHVVIRDAAGELRTFTAAEIEFAGADSPGPERAAPDDGSASAADFGHTVRFETDQPGLRVSRRAGVTMTLTSERFEIGSATTWTELCVAPCTTEVPPGELALALAHGPGRPLVADTLTADHPLRLFVHLDDRSLERGIGAGMLLFGIVALVFLPWGIVTAAQGRLEPAFLGIGIGATAIALGGIPLAAWGDTRTVRVLSD